MERLRDMALKRQAEKEARDREVQEAARLKDIERLLVTQPEGVAMAAAALNAT